MINNNIVKKEECPETMHSSTLSNLIDKWSDFDKILRVTSLCLKTIALMTNGIKDHIRRSEIQQKSFSIAFISLNGARAIGGIIGVLALSSVIGASLGILVGCAVGALIAYRKACPGTTFAPIRDGMGRELGHIVHALMVLFTLTNVDVLLARLYLSDTGSSEYSVGVLLAKIAFFLPNAVLIVLFPKMSGQNSRRPVLIASGLTVAVGLVITAFAFFFPLLLASFMASRRRSHSFHL